MLLCPVRGCNLPLLRRDTQLQCERGHSFDISRSGYVNLLQPQDRRSRQPGDTAEAVRGRRHLHDLGVTAPLLEAISGLLAASPGETVLDAGCGDGFYLGSLAGQSRLSAHGIDISAAAIEAAANRYPACEWIVANADRRIPYADRTFSAVLSITARRNPTEFHRVLHEGGRLLVAIPAPDDLMELRGPGTRDRVPRTLEEFAPFFTLAARRRITTAADLDTSSVRDILHSVYRPLHSTPLQAMRITFSLDLLLLRAL